jgi:hypothetical protein
VPPPIERPERHFELSSHHFLYSTDRVAEARSALTWFQRAAAATATRPRKDGAFDPLDPDAEAFVAGPFEEEPPAPETVTTTVRVLFLANWCSNARVRHLLPSDFNTAMLWTPEELERAIAWLQEDTRFPWTSFREFLGAIHLVAPNPVFRNVRGRIDRSQGNVVLVYTFELRAGKTASGLGRQQSGPRHASLVGRTMEDFRTRSLDLSWMPRRSFTERSGVEIHRNVARSRTMNSHGPRSSNPTLKKVGARRTKKTEDKSSTRPKPSFH